MKTLHPKICIGVIALVLSACGSGSTDPTRLTLQNDSYAGGDPPTFQAGLIAGDGLGALFAARSSAYTVGNVRFLFGGNATPRTVTLTLYAVTGPSTRVPIHTDDYQLTPSDASFQEIDLSGAGIEVEPGEELLVAILFQHNDLPGIGIDSDGRTAGRNWVYGGTSASWRAQETFVGVDGDWIIRAEIEEG